MLEKQAQRQLGYGEYTIVVVTDGIAGSPELLSRVVNVLSTDPGEHLSFEDFERWGVGKITLSPH